MTENTAFVRTVRVETVPDGGVEHLIEANEAERVALAKSIGLAAIQRLTGKFILSRAGRGAIRARGEVHAEVTQICVVSLEPFDVALDEDLDVRYAPSAGEAPGRRKPPIATARAADMAADDDDEPDPIVDGKINLGALAVEFLVLGLDPYPRKPGVEFSAPSTGERDADASVSGLKDGSEKN
jgi:uncharacterized metal-binding protein YceD (DUF177 family)